METDTNHLWIGFLSFALFVLGFPVVVSGQQNSLTGVAMQINARLQTDGQLTVTEEITYNFGSEPRRGVIRELAVPKGGAVSIQSVSRDGLQENYQTAQAGQSKQIRTGTKGIKVSGEHTYTFTYTVDGLIRSGQSGLQLVWPAVPGPSMPIEDIVINLQLPDSASAVRCRIGMQNYGCPVDQTPNGVQATAADLAPGERLTIRANIPESAVQIANSKDKNRHWGYWLGPGLVLLLGIIWMSYRLGIASDNEPPEPETSDRIDTLNT